MKQKTFDDLEPVLESQLSITESLIHPDKVKPRSRDALKLYDLLQEKLLIEEDPLY